MMTQGVMTQITNQGYSTAGSSQTKGFSKSVDFDLVMNQNLNSTQNTYSMKQGKSVTKEVKDYKDAKHTKSETLATKGQKNDFKVDQAEKKATNTSDSDVKSVQKDNIRKADSMDETKVVKDPTEDSQLQEQVMGMLQALQEAVMELLNITQEELDQLLVEQGLSVGDLTNIDSLKQLILGNSGKTDIMEFLTDGNLASSLHRLTEAVNSIQKEYGLMMSEGEFDAAVRRLLETELVPVENPEEVLKAPTREELNKDSELYNKISASKNQDDGSNVEDTIKPTVEVINVLEAEDAREGNWNDTERETSSEADSGNQFEAFLDNLVAGQGETKIEFTGDTVRVTELREIASQIIEQIKVIVKPENTSMELQLNPEHLGKVHLHIESKEGSMTAQFVVQNEMAKEAIEGQLQTLKETLNHQGIKVEAIEVTVSNFTFDQGGGMEQNGQQAGNNQSGGQRLTLEEAFAMQDGTEIIGPDESVQGITGTNIDMTA